MTSTKGSISAGLEGLDQSSRSDHVPESDNVVVLHGTIMVV